jgi:hypothetical protein
MRMQSILVIRMMRMQSILVILRRIQVANIEAGEEAVDADQECDCEQVVTLLL